MIPEVVDILEASEQMRIQIHMIPIPIFENLIQELPDLKF